MEKKTVPSIYLKADNETGIVEHIIAVMGNVDMGGDVIHSGAFTKTISERGGKIRVLDNHNYDSVLRVVGKPVQMREISRGELPAEILDKYPDADGALWAKTQFLLDTPEGLGAFKRIKAGAVDEWSIGYDALDFDYERSEEDGKTIQDIRHLRTLRLWEYGPVIWGMNPATMTLSAKAVSGSTSLPLAPRDRPWDATSAVRRMRDWAGAEDVPNSKYRSGFFYYDPDNVDNFGAYKLPFADVIDGTLYAIPRGIFAVAGGRGVDAADIPPGDKEAIKGKVNSYYARMRREFDDDTLTSPFEKGEDGGEEVKDRFADRLYSGLVGYIQTSVKELVKGIEEEEKYKFISEMDERLAELCLTIPENIANIDIGAIEVEEVEEVGDLSETDGSEEETETGEHEEVGTEAENDQPPTFEEELLNVIDNELMDLDILEELT